MWELQNGTQGNACFNKKFVFERIQNSNASTRHRNSGYKHIEHEIIAFVHDRAL